MPDTKDLARVIHLLEATAKAHQAYEAEEMDGLHDENWHHWYAAYLIENGLLDMMHGPINQGELAEFFTESYAHFEKDAPDENWQTYTAEAFLRRFTT